MAEDMRYMRDRRKGEGHEIPKGCKGKGEG